MADVSSGTMDGQPLHSANPWPQWLNQGSFCNLTHSSLVELKCKSVQPRHPASDFLPTKKMKPTQSRVSWMEKFCDGTTAPKGMQWPSSLYHSVQLETPLHATEASIFAASDDNLQWIITPPGYLTILTEQLKNSFQISKRQSRVHVCMSEKEFIQKKMEGRVVTYTCNRCHYPTHLKKVSCRHMHLLEGTRQGNLVWHIAPWYASWQGITNLLTVGKIAFLSSRFDVILLRSYLIIGKSFVPWSPNFSAEMFWGKRKAAVINLFVPLARFYVAS